MHSPSTGPLLELFPTVRLECSPLLRTNSRLCKVCSSQLVVYVYFFLSIRKLILIEFKLLFPVSHLQTTFELTPNAQIWPRALNSEIGGTAGVIYLIVGDLRRNSGQGLDFVNGQTFLERFYSVFDTANQRVGLATTPFTDATTN